jgi:hypothetical protein
VHYGTLRNQHQLDTLFLVCLLGVNASGIIRPTSGGAAQMLFGVITCVGCVLTMFEFLAVGRHKKTPTSNVWYSRVYVVSCILVHA